jgi:hypothetical protein
VDDLPGTENWTAVSDAIRGRMRQLQMSKATLARETGLSETTIRYIGRPENGHHKSALVAISAALPWRHDHLVNVLRGQPEKNTPGRTATEAGLERLLHVHLAPLKDEIAQLRELALAIDKRTAALLAPFPSKTVHDSNGKGSPMDAISNLPMLHDMEADYSPQYVKLARILRDRIKAGHLKHSKPLPAPRLASEYGVSVRVAQAAIFMLAANRYVTQPGNSGPYRVSWQDAISNDNNIRAPEKTNSD